MDVHDVVDGLCQIECTIRRDEADVRELREYVQLLERRLEVNRQIAAMLAEKRRSR